MADVRIEYLDGRGADNAELEELLFDVLYRDFGVGPDARWQDDEPGSLIAVALAADGELLGAARLLPAAGDGSRQVRQVAVLPGARSQGVGRALMDALERRAAAQGAREVWLHARDTAFAFYERLGYAFSSEPFVSELTGIVHRTMRKPLR